MTIAETLYAHRLAKSASGERDCNFFCTCFEWSTMTANTSGHAHQEWIHHIDSVLNEAFTITSKPVPSCNRLDVTEWMLKRGWYSVSRGPAGEMWSHLSDQFRCLAVPFLFEAEHEAMVIDRLRVWEGYNSNDEVRLSIARLAAFNREAIT